ncbi:MAG: oxidoreductase [Bdellovibrionota bacterium]
MKCLVAGASGLVGNELMKLLLAEEKVEQVISIGRRPTAFTHEKLIEKKVSWEKLPTGKSMEADTAFCCLGTTLDKAGSKEAFSIVDKDYVIEFAKLAKNSGVKNFLVVSAMGANSKSLFFYNKVKGQMEKALREVNFSSIYIIRPSLLLGTRQESRPTEEWAQRLYPVYHAVMVGPLAAYKPIPAGQVALSMLKFGLKPKPGLHIIKNNLI